MNSHCKDNRAQPDIPAYEGPERRLLTHETCVFHRVHDMRLAQLDKRITDLEMSKFVPFTNMRMTVSILLAVILGLNATALTIAYKAGDALTELRIKQEKVIFEVTRMRIDGGLTALPPMNYPKLPRDLDSGEYQTDDNKSGKKLQQTEEPR
jgi:hypothetical protein